MLAEKGICKKLRELEGKFEVLDEVAVTQKMILERVEKLEKGLMAYGMLWGEEQEIEIREVRRGWPFFRDGEGMSGSDVKSVQGMVVDPEADGE